MKDGNPPKKNGFVDTPDEPELRVVLSEKRFAERELKEAIGKAASLKRRAEDIEKQYEERKKKRELETTKRSWVDLIPDTPEERVAFAEKRVKEVEADSALDKALFLRGEAVELEKKAKILETKVEEIEKEYEKRKKTLEEAKELMQQVPQAGDIVVGDSSQNSGPGSTPTTQGSLWRKIKSSFLRPGN